jgi:hypothetical protein
LFERMSAFPAGVLVNRHSGRNYIATRAFGEAPPGA